MGEQESNETEDGLQLALYNYSVRSYINFRTFSFFLYLQM
jgi:hypothetical protein